MLPTCCCSPRLLEVKIIWALERERDSNSTNDGHIHFQHKSDLNSIVLMRHARARPSKLFAARLSQKAQLEGGQAKMLASWNWRLLIELAVKQDSVKETACYLKSEAASYCPQTRKAAYSLLWKQHQQSPLWLGFRFLMAAVKLARRQKASSLVWPITALLSYWRSFFYLFCKLIRQDEIWRQVRQIFNSSDLSTLLRNIFASRRIKQLRCVSFWPIWFMMIQKGRSRLVFYHFMSNNKA